METQKIANSLNASDNEQSKFATKKRYVIDSDAKGNYSKDHPIKVLTNSLGSSPCHYSDAYILVTRNITVKRRNAANTDDIALGAITQVVLKNCSPFKNCRKKSMTLLLMMPTLLILQCLCTT